MKALQAEGLSHGKPVRSLSARLKRTISLRKPPEDPQLRERLKAIAERWPRFGYPRLMIMVQREGIDVSWWRLRRLYRALQLKVRPRRKRHVRYVRGSTVMPVSQMNERWSIDFILDRLSFGRPIRALVVVDDFTRKCLAIDVAFSFGSRDVIRVFEGIARERGVPVTMRFDRGSEFTSRAMPQWSAEQHVAMPFSDPGKPTQNAQVEALNGRIRDEL